MTAAEIKHWLALVANARLAVSRVQAAVDNVPEIDAWEVNRAAEYLENAFQAGLEAHSQAVLKEYLAESNKTTAA